MLPVHLALAAVVVATLAVLVAAYRHALAHWLAPSTPPLPVATLGRGRDPSPSWSRRAHAAIIAIAFASVALMILTAVAMLGLAVAG